MNHTDTTPVCSQSGRKGIVYDWQSLYAATQAEGIDGELASLTLEFAK